MPLPDGLNPGAIDGVFVDLDGTVVHEAELLPSATAIKLPFEAIEGYLPAARRVGPEERRATIAMRQRHVRHRYRTH